MPANTVNKNILFCKLAANSLNIPKSAGDNNATFAFLLARSFCLAWHFMFSANKNHVYFEILTNAQAPQTVSLFNLTIWEKE